MASPDQEIVLEIKQEPSWQSEYGSNQEGFEMGYKEEEERSSRSPDSQGTENIEMEELDNESATVEDLGEEWCEDETGNLCDPLCHMTSDVLGSPELSDGGDAGSYSSKRRTTPKGGAQGGRAGRALKRTLRGKTNRTQTRATPPGGKLGDQSSEGHTRGHGENHNQGHDLDDEEVLADMPQSPGKRTETDSPAMKKKRKTARLVLSDEQEEGLVEWLQSYPELFDKSHRRYKDIDLKSNLWEQKAAELGVESGELLQVWYKSMRTRFGKLRRITSVGRKREFTWRDQWILKNFAFISPHIYACPNRGTGFPKHKLQSKSCGQWSTSQQHSGSEDDDNDDDLYKIPNIPISIAVTSPSATSSATISTAALATCKGPVQIESIQPSLLPDANPVKQISQPDSQADQLLAGISATILSGQNGSMAKGYGTFLSTVVPSLHPSLLTQFYQESWAMVMRYHTQSEELKEKERQRPPVPVTVRPVHPLPQVSKYNPRPAAQPSSKVQSGQTRQSSQVVVHLEERS